MNTIAQPGVEVAVIERYYARMYRELLDTCYKNDFVTASSWHLHIVGEGKVKAILRRSKFYISYFKQRTRHYQQFCLEESVIPC